LSSPLDERAATPATDFPRATATGDEDERVREWDPMVSDCEDGPSRGPGQVQ